MDVEMTLLLGRIGTTQVLILLVVVALLFGAKRIPELARSLGRAKSEFERGLSYQDGRKDEDEEHEDDLELQGPGRDGAASVQGGVPPTP